MSLPVYSSRDVQVAWGGAAITGLAADSFVTFSRNAPLTTTGVGADGQLHISRNPDRTGTCTISLQQNSPGSIILSGVMHKQEQEASFVTGALSISDPSGSVLAYMRGVHLQEPPEVTLGSDGSGSTLNWVFFCEELKFTSAPEGLAQGLVGSAAIAGAIETIMANADNVTTP